MEKEAGATEPGPSKRPEDQVYELEKQLRTKGAVANKDRAVLEQKVQLLELQVRESKEREDNMRKMHETMISALRQANSETNSTPKMLELANEMHKKDMTEMQERHHEAVGSLERQLAEVKQQNADLDSAVKQLSKGKMDLEADIMAKERAYETLKREHDEKVRRLEEERRKLKDAIELDSQLKANNINQVLDKIREEHGKELSRVKAESERALQDIKYIHEQEKIAMADRLDKTAQDLKSLQAVKDNNANMSISMQSMQNNYLTEIQELNSHLDAFKKQSYEEIACLKKQRDDAYKKIESLIAAKSVPVAAAKNGQITDRSAKTRQTEETKKELTRLRKQNNDLKSYVSKLEASERKLRAQQSTRKENVGADTVSKRVLSSDRRNLPRSLEGTAAKHKGGPEELLVDSCEPAMPDSMCGYQFSTKAVVQQKPENEKRKIEESEALSVSSFSLRMVGGEPENREGLSKKLQATEEVLQDMTLRMEKLQRQRDRVQSELDRVNSELTNAKAQRELAEEKKAETENSLKTEIKNLITKLMQTKEKIAQNMSTSSTAPAPVPANSLPAPESVPTSLQQSKIHSSNQRQKHQRSVSICGASGGKSQRQPVAAGEGRRQSCMGSRAEDDNTCSDDMDEYESGSALPSVRKVLDYPKKSLHDIN